MKVLVINGDCVQTNSSANLCHLSYIKGLLESGYDVTLLSADGRDYCLDSSMIIPEKVKHITFYGVSLYERLSIIKKQRNKNHVQEINNSIVNTVDKKRIKDSIVSRLKKLLISLYGVHGTYSKFVRKAKNFTSNEEYDYIISISTPVSSHLLAHKLIKSGHVSCKKWIQVWEDPWWGDIYGFNNEIKKFKEERRLLSFAQHICYVSPLTMKNRQELFPESAHKMFWQPLPSYYSCENIVFNDDSNSYGYFGDYVPVSRDLKPFYDAAVACHVNVNICGNPCDLFNSVDNVSIHPRLPLNELKAIEDKTNVLVFLCNRQGGQIPGKIYQYCATNKTILFILDGTDEEKKELKAYFEKYDRFVFCENTVEDISMAINRIESGNIDVINEPLTCFNAKDIIKNILDCKNG